MLEEDVAWAPAVPVVVSLEELLGEPLGVMLGEPLAEPDDSEEDADEVDETLAVQLALVGTSTPFAPQRLTAKSIVSVYHIISNTRLKRLGTADVGRRPVSILWRRSRKSLRSTPYLHRCI